MMPLDLPALADHLLRVAQRDEAALAALYDALAARVHALALRVCADDTPRAERLTEDVFWRVWREAPRFDAARDQPAAWVLSLVDRR
jgi:RNA polymerase sigma-70 factor, ECF subfamily